MAELFANSGDPDQMPHSVASDLCLYCLPITLLGVSRLQRAKALVQIFSETLVHKVKCDKRTQKKDEQSKSCMLTPNFSNLGA